MSLFCIAALWKMLTHNELSMTNSIYIIFGYLIEKGTNKQIRSYSPKNNLLLGSSFVILVIIWLFSASVLSKAFSGKLLETHFFVERLPIVNSLDELRNNKQIGLAAEHSFLLQIADLYNINLDDLLERSKLDPDNYPMPFTSRLIAEKVINLKSVLMVTTLTKDMFLDLTKFYIDKLILLENKYFPEYLAMYVSKNLSHSSIVHY